MKNSFFENGYYKIKFGELGNKKLINEYCFILDEEFNFKTEHIKDNVYLSSDYVVGKVSDIKSIPIIGYLYLFFTSKKFYKYDGNCHI